MFTAEQRSEYARYLGSRTSERKAESSRKNGKKGGGVMKPLVEIPCTCGGEGLEHPTTCPRGRVIRYRTKKGLPLL
jgi:hypothetical protein